MYFSLESEFRPGRFIRHFNYRLRADPFKDNAQFKADAQFRIVGAEVSAGPEMDRCYKLFSQNLKKHSWGQLARAQSNHGDAFRFVAPLNGRQGAVSIELCEAQGMSKGQ